MALHAGRIGSYNLNTRIDTDGKPTLPFVKYILCEDVMLRIVED